MSFLLGHMRITVVVLFVWAVFLSDRSPVIAEEPGAEVFLDVWGVQLDVAAENDGDIHLSYRRSDSIYYLRQLNGTWDDERLVPGADETTYNTRWYPNIAVDTSGNAHFAWSGPSNLAVYYNALVIDSWSGLVEVLDGDDTSTDENRADIAVDLNNNVFVVGQNDYSIKYNRKPFGGTWQTAGIIFASYPGVPQYPSLSASKVDTSVHFTCAHNLVSPSNGIQYHKWIAGNWGSANRPWGTGGPCCANNTATAVDKYGKPHIAWIRFIDDVNASHLYYVCQQSTGVWSNIDTLISSAQYFNANLDGHPAECVLPRIAVADNDDVMIVYADGYPNTSKVYYRLRYHETGLWSSPKRMTTGSEYQNYPGLTVRNNTFTVVWSDSRHSGMGIFMKKIISTDLPAPLAAPVLDTANVSDNSVYLNWTAPPDPLKILDHYIIERQLDSGLWLQVATTRQNSFVDDDFWLGTHFTYRIKAVDLYMRVSQPSNALDVFADVPSVSTIALIALLILMSALFMRKRTSIKFSSDCDDAASRRR